MKPKADKEPKKDCFAYNIEHNNCKALSELVCSYKNKCSFYKHRKDVSFAAIEMACNSYNGGKK